MNKVLKDIIFGIILIATTIIITFVLRTYFFTFDKTLTSEQKEIIEKYISDTNNSYLEEGMTFTSVHYFGSRYNNDELKVYLWALFSEYDTSNNRFEEHRGFSIPHVININVKDDNFEIISYDIPKDGSFYKNSITELFPITIRNKVLKFHDSKECKKLFQEHDEMINTYQEYFKGDE